MGKSDIDEKIYELLQMLLKCSKTFLLLIAM